MLMGLASTLEGGCSPGSVAVPPKGFRSAEGLRSAWIAPEGPFGRGPSPLRGTPAQKAGIRYERKVAEHVREQYVNYTVGQWWGFVDRAGYRRWCQTDGFLMTPEGAIIFEVKVRGVPDAYFQLHQLYRPVVQRALPGVKIVALVMVCKHFDPMVRFPEEPEHLSDIALHSLSKPTRPVWSVYTWKG